MKMVLKYVHIAIGLFIFGFSLNVNSSPVSTEYVKGAIDALRNEINSLINSVQTQVNHLPIITPKLGEIYQGGIVFWLDESRQHGLNAAVSDHPEVQWRTGEGGDRIVNAKANGIYAGNTNTKLIVSEQTIDDPGP